MKIVKNILLLIIVLLLFVAGFIFYHLQTNAVVSIDEIVPDDEAQQIAHAVDIFENIVTETQTSYASRGAHSKGHACVKAYFKVNEDIDPRLQYGVFSKPGQQYQSWIRFSNGNSNVAKSDDNNKDTRGMAIKLFNLAGLSQVENNTTTQEFLAHNSPAFFSVSLQDYNQLIESDDKIKYFLPGSNPFKWRLRELSHVFDTLGPAPISPIWDEYFSNTAYKLGSHNIKFMIKSCTEHKTKATVPRTGADFLKNTLVSELAADSACMDFQVQLQDAAKLMPIEDASVLWKQKDSPFIPVARITILKQQFDSVEQRQFCENLSFSPWNTLPQHRPIGTLNRVRKMVYQASSDLRHKLNKTKIPTSLQWSENSDLIHDVN